MESSTTGSSRPIDELNQGLKLLETHLRGHPDAKRCVRLMVVKVSDSQPTTVVDWVDAEQFVAPTLFASGGTPLGEGVRMALAGIRSEMQFLKSEGVARKIPWVWIFTDGAPNPGWESAAAECSAAHKANQVMVFPIAVGAGADVTKLGNFSKDQKVYQIRDTDFQKLFEFISASAIIGSAQPGVTEIMPLFGQIAAR